MAPPFLCLLLSFFSLHFMHGKELPCYKTNLIISIHKFVEYWTIKGGPHNKQFRLCGEIFFKKNSKLHIISKQKRISFPSQYDKR